MKEQQKIKNIQEGAIISGFLVEKITKLSKLKNHMVQLTHQKTDAKMIHLANEDPNNCFSVAFRTTPKNSRGVAHILEHTALCGSEKYPVRDPFFSMTRRSMNTFMNAFTASDWTMYPVASQNEKDFYNLMEVYLDAAFFPKLLEENFMQEGHRLEFQQENDMNSPLVIKGIVYNEMKGAMSSTSSIMHRRLAQSLFPTITYQYNSGGEPSEIPDLTWEDLKDFHKVHYHPSNAWFFTYGDLPLETHLEFIHEKTLNHFEKIDPNTKIHREQRYQKPQNFEYTYALDQEEDDGRKCQFVLAWLCCDVLDSREVLSLQLLSQILLGDAAAPLRKQLIESKIGKALADPTGYADDIRETYFSVGLQGMSSEDMEKVKNIIETTLKEVVEEGIDQERIETAIHKMELTTREISGGSYPYSLNLLFRFFGNWMHGGDPITSIDFDENIEHLKKKIRKEPFLEQQIEKYFLKNPHRVEMLLKPDHEKESKEREELAQKLAEMKRKMSRKEKEAILQKAAHVKSFQEQEEDLSCLPTLHVEDIPKEIRRVDPIETNWNKKSIEFYDQPTNGLTYINWHFQTDAFSEEERLWLPLVGSLLTKCGADGMNYEEVAKYVSRYTGGFSAGPGIHGNLFDRQKFEDSFNLSAKALTTNQEKLFEIAQKFITTPDFSNYGRVKNLIDQRTNALENSIVDSGHSYAAGLAKRYFSPSCYIDELYEGIHQIRFMKELASKTEDELPSIIDRVNQIVNKLFSKKALSLLVIGEKESFNETKKLLDKFYDTLPNTKTNQNVSVPFPTLSQEPPKEAWLTTTTVSYVAKCFQTPGYTDSDAPKLLVLGRLLQSCFLHGEIREKGGAYGGMSGFNAEDGIFSMLSYRDPHLSRTLEVYEKATQWATLGNFSDQDVEEAILQTCSRMDTPQSPAGKAMKSYADRRKKKTYKMREKFRETILNCQKQDLIEVANKWLTGKASIAVITNENMLQQGKSISSVETLKVERI